MDEIEQLVIAVRADTAGFRRDVGELRGALEGPLGAGADQAGRAIEGTLLRAVRSGKLGFEDLKTTALSVLGEIAGAAVLGGVGAVLGGGRGGGAGGIGAGLLGTLAGLVGGAPGRATGGPVSPNRAYRVGERGPELFVPTASGSVVAAGGAGVARDVRVAITVRADGAAPAALQRSSRQVARAVKAALAGVED